MEWLNLILLKTAHENFHFDVIIYVFVVFFSVKYGFSDWLELHCGEYTHFDADHALTFCW